MTMDRRAFSAASDQVAAKILPAFLAAKALGFSPNISS
jgi:hypothetical protein